MGLERTSLLALYRGGYLHDVGKVGIPDSILFRPGPLTAQEWVDYAQPHDAGRRDLPPPEIAPPGAAHHPAITMSVSTAPGIPTACGASRFRCWRA